MMYKVRVVREFLTDGLLHGKDKGYVVVPFGVLSISRDHVSISDHLIAAQAQKKRTKAKQSGWRVWQRFISC